MKNSKSTYYLLLLSFFVALLSTDGHSFTWTRLSGEVNPIELYEFVDSEIELVDYTDFPVTRVYQLLIPSSVELARLFEFEHLSELHRNKLTFYYSSSFLHI